MNETIFGLDTLKDLDFGKINVAFEHEVRRVVDDCIDRPMDEKSRTVTIKFILAPKPDIDQQSHHVRCESVMVGCEVQSTIPKRTTQIYAMTPKKDGSIVFHPELPMDPQGSTLYDDVDKTTGEVKGKGAE